MSLLYSYNLGSRKQDYRVGKTTTIMRRIFLLASTAFVMILTSCGGSADSDAKKLAELQCKIMKNPGDAASLQKEAKELSDKLEGKYTSEADKKKFAEAYLKAMGECK